MNPVPTAVMVGTTAVCSGGFANLQIDMTGRLPFTIVYNDGEENITIETYKDHRMAMAFATLALKVPIIIKEASVVSKSYPNFWSDLKSIGFKIQN